MALCELSDLVGAIGGYLHATYGDSLTIDDLVVMAQATERAFRSGRR